MSRKNKRIKFIWGAGKVIQGRWHFGLWGHYERLDGHPDSGLAISMRGVTVLVLILGLLGYVTGATGVYLWLDRRDNSYVTYTDVLLLPVRWHEVQQKRGRAYMDEGIADLRNQRWSQGVMKLRLGLARDPGVLRPRLALAQFYVLARERKQALDVLAAGLAAAPDYPGRVYLSNYFSLAMQGNDYDRVLKACARYLDGSHPDLTEKERRWLLEQKVNALLSADRFQEAMSALKSAPHDDRFDEKRVLTLLDLKHPRQALKFLAQWQAREGETPQILRLQARACRDLGDTRQLDAYLEKYRRLRPADARVYAYVIVQRKLAGLDAEANTALSDYFFRFNGYRANLNLLANPLGEIGAVKLLQRCVSQADEMGYDRMPFLLALTRAQLKKEQWAAALQTAKTMQESQTRKRNPRMVDQVQLETLLAQLAAAPTPGSEDDLLQLLGRRYYALSTYRGITEVLMRTARYDAALQVITQAERSYTLDDTLTEDKAKATAKMAALQKKAVTAVAATTPDKDQALSIERVFFKRVDAAMAAHHWAAVLTMIQDLQQARPNWLSARMQDVLLRQMRAAQGAQEPLTMTLAAHQLLDGSLSRAQLVVGYARQLHEAGDNDDAVRLLREVLNGMPRHALAKRLLKQWTAKEKAPAGK